MWPSGGGCLRRALRNERHALANEAQESFYHRRPERGSRSRQARPSTSPSMLAPQPWALGPQAAYKPSSWWHFVMAAQAGQVNQFAQWPYFSYRSKKSCSFFQFSFALVRTRSVTYKLFACCTRTLNSGVIFFWTANFILQDILLE